MAITYTYIPDIQIHRYCHVYCAMYISIYKERYILPLPRKMPRTPHIPHCHQHIPLPDAAPADSSMIQQYCQPATTDKLDRQRRHYRYANIAAIAERATRQHHRKIKIRTHCQPCVCVCVCVCVIFEEAAVSMKSCRHCRHAVEPPHALSFHASLSSHLKKISFSSEQLQQLRTHADLLGEASETAEAACVST